jgi:hypothetical protein
MREYARRVVEAMVANGCSLESIDHFIESRSHLSEEERSVMWLFAWSKSARENRRRRVAELIEGERHLAGRAGANGRLYQPGAFEFVGGRNQFGPGVGD